VSITENVAIVHRVVDAFNEGDEAAVDELFASRYVDHDPARIEAPFGPAGVRQVWAALRAAVPDARLVIHDTVAESATVAVRGDICGTHQGELLGLQPTGRTVRLSLIDFSRIIGGQVVERWGEADTLGLLHRLRGAAPVDGADPTPGRPPIGRAPGADHGNGQAQLRANKALVLRFNQIVLNGHRLDRAGEFLAPDIVAHLAGTTEPVIGIENWCEVFGGFFAAIPDYSETVYDIVTEGDRVAARLTFGGTQAGYLFGARATGRMFAVGAMAFLRISNRLIAEMWTEADLVGVLGQLGAIAPAGPPTPEPTPSDR
jgi:predicted ester cyclase